MTMQLPGGLLEEEITGSIINALFIVHRELGFAFAVEIKSTERLHPEAERQLLNYLRATRFEVGLVLHFGRSAAFRRVVDSNANKRLPHDTSVQPEVIDEPPPLIRLGVPK